jgi:prevent-host-death family protein
MTEATVGVRELKARLSKYLREVKAGRSVTITERGKAVGRLVPSVQSLDEKLRGLVKSSRAQWNGKRLPRVKHVARARRGHSVAALLIEDRR